MSKEQVYVRCLSVKIRHSQTAALCFVEAVVGSVNVILRSLSSYLTSRCLDPPNFLPGRRHQLHRRARLLIRHACSMLTVPGVMGSPLGGDYLAALRTHLLVPEYLQLASKDSIDGAAPYKNRAGYS